MNNRTYKAPQQTPVRCLACVNPMFTVADARQYAVNAFAQSAVFAEHSRSSLSLDADVLLQHLLQKPRIWLFAHADTDISNIQHAFFDAVHKRCTGFPIAYITGKKEFWGLPFFVTPDVLIPKPDTELLVERSLALIQEKISQFSRPLCILDPCTGSGCVIISILRSLSEQRITNVYAVAADISEAALAIARRNAQNLLPPAMQNRLLIVKGDMRKLDNLAITLPEHYHPFDLIAANPPYVPSRVTQQLLTDGRSEPQLALDGGTDGLDFIKILANNIAAFLHTNGVLLSEAGEYHAAEAALLFEQAGFSGIRIHKDLAQQNRLIEGVMYGAKN